MAVLSIKCPNCGGELLFDPASQNYKCEYCASEFTQQQIDTLYPDAGRPQGEADAGASAGAAQQNQSGQSAQFSQSGMDENASEGILYHCPSCGAQIVTSATTAATFCYYCHNPVVLEGRLSGTLLPDRIIPFQISREQAKERFESFLRSKKFLPKGFYSEDQIEKMTGVYYPYWCYESTVDGSFEATGNKIRVWRTGETEYTETSVYHVTRGGQVSFRNMIANALRESNRALVEQVQPFNLSEVKPFTMSYLSGFQAEARDLEKAQFADTFQNSSKDYAMRLMRESVSGYTSLTERGGSYSISKENWTYLLLPVWLLTYQSHDKTYYYAMNGQTGETCGKLPVNTGKLLGVCAAVTGILMALFMLGGYYL